MGITLRNVRGKVFAEVRTGGKTYVKPVTTPQSRFRMKR